MVVKKVAITVIHDIEFIDHIPLVYMFNVKEDATICYYKDLNKYTPN
jgi:hypothetical protein